MAVAPVLYIDFANTVDGAVYDVAPLQVVQYVNAGDKKVWQFSRDEDDLIWVVQNRQVRLRGVFRYETVALYPYFSEDGTTFVSAYTIVVENNPSMITQCMEATPYGSPQGSIVEMVHKRYEQEESIVWELEPELYVPPTRTLEDTVSFAPAEDETPVFYDMIQEERPASHNTDAVHDIHPEDVPNEGMSISDTATEVENVHTAQSYECYLLTQENLDAGFYIVDMNNNPENLEQMVQGYYGYIYMTYYGYVSYTLFDGVFPDAGGYLEDYATYSILSSDGNVIPGELTIQTYYDEMGNLAYIHYSTEV